MNAHAYTDIGLKSTGSKQKREDVNKARIAITKPEDAVMLVGEDDKDGIKGKTTELGRKALIPNGLYVAHGFYSPYLAESTEVSELDLKLFWEALVNMWDSDRSASRGMMAPRGIYIFSHENKLGNAPAHKLFERIQPELKVTGSVPRKFSDYEVTVDDTSLPEGITLTRLIEG